MVENISEQENTVDTQEQENAVEQENIENKLVKRSLKDMKDGGYLSTEIMQFLCENKLSDSIDKNECSELLTSINSAMKQYKADKADKAMEMSNIDNER